MLTDIPHSAGETGASLTAFAEIAAIAREAAPRPRRAPRPARNPAMLLLRAVMRLAGEQAGLLRHVETPWASITFAGTRHMVSLSFSGEAGVAAGERFIEALPDHVFAIPRQLVADAAVAAMIQDALPVPRMIVEVELLLLEEG